MEPIFSTTLIVKGQPVEYKIYFREDAYHFEAEGSDAPEILLKKEHDEWHTQSNTDDILTQTAASALDRYLLSQH